MSAAKSGTGHRKFGARIGQALMTATREMFGDFISAIERFRTSVAQRRRLSELHRINDHALRDVGLVRDRFSGVILNNDSGDVVEIETPLRENILVPSAAPGNSNYRGTVRCRNPERRSTDRRLAQRRNDDRAGQEPSRPERRCVDRRTASSQVVDCRELFLKRSRFLMA
ncbi:hypothetical protein [Pelagibius sp. Alg239-R121]|uniref:hypothetical protein n=1 Tax=Pelagibius sp. Alg239-R121 TaxID=2993448 RepID=UPI0024A6559A|nr:hypothetical protein [Pelagibius sp. Alg239-R121]